MSERLVSVITASYNTEQFLPQTVESVLAQTYGNWEMIIVDDFSTDGSYEIAKRFASENSRIKAVRLKKNSGPAVARNKGISLAEGRFIAFLDSDDLWKEQKLERQVEFMDHNSYAFTYTQYEQIDEDGKKLACKSSPPSRLNYEELLKSNQIGCLTAMYDVHKLGKVYMPDLIKRQDYGLWLKILKTVDFAYCLDESLAFYRVRKNSVSSSKLDLVKYNWDLFRDIEQFSRIKSSYYLLFNIYRKMTKK